jgi:hypothetical protein
MFLSHIGSATIHGLPVAHLWIKLHDSQYTTNVLLMAMAIST